MFDTFSVFKLKLTSIHNSLPRMVYIHKGDTSQYMVLIIRYNSTLKILYRG